MEKKKEEAMFEVHHDPEHDDDFLLRMEKACVST
jgi:hypothetical protein